MTAQCGRPDSPRMQLLHFSPWRRKYVGLPSSGVKIWTVKNVLFQQAEIVIWSDCVHGGCTSIRMWVYNKLSLRVIFTCHYTPPKPHFSTRAIWTWEQIVAKIVRGATQPTKLATLLPRFANLLTKRRIKYGVTGSVRVRDMVTVRG